VVLPVIDSCPIATLEIPVVFASKAKLPTATFVFPVVLAAPALYPTPTLFAPVVFNLKE